MRRAQLAVFAAAPLDVVIPDGEWRTAQVNHDYAAAMTRDRDVCFLIIVRGSESDIDRIVQQKNR
jgi:hypothetical protein